MSYHDFSDEVRALGTRADQFGRLFGWNDLKGDLLFTALFLLIYVPFLLVWAILVYGVAIVIHLT